MNENDEFAENLVPASPPLQEFRVPITVFTTVHAADFGEAASTASIAVRRALEARAVVGEKPPTLLVHYSNGRTDRVHVHKVMETGAAGINGYLWTEASSKAYRESR